MDLNRYQRSSLGDAHLIALNITDLLICCLSLAMLFFFNGVAKEAEDFMTKFDAEITNAETETHFSVHRYWYILVALPYRCMALLSCFITAMLSATRTLSLVKPLYNINRKFVCLAYGICISIPVITLGTNCYAVVSSSSYKDTAHNANETMKQLTQISNATGIVDLGMVLITVAIVSICTAISVKTLKTSNEVSRGQAANNENCRKATKMILTLSIIFVICNGTWTIIWVVIYAFLTIGNGSMERLMGIFLNIVVVSLNSSANPIVYMTRNSALKDYTKTHLTRLMSFITLCLSKR